MSNVIVSFNLAVDPPHNQRHNIINLRLTQRPALLDSMPFLNTLPATGGGGMLGDEHRMSAHWGLFAVILGIIRGDSRMDKLKSVLPDGLKVLLCDVRAVF